MKQFICIIAFLLALPLAAQQTITLEDCYQWVKVNYPLSQQTDLLNKQYEFDNQIISNENLPKINVEAQATYQSEVMKVPIPNANITPLNKDQYRATLSINQLIYNGGATHRSREVKNAQLKTKQQQIEVSLYQLKFQVNQLYFSILLYQEKMLLLKAKENQLLANIKEVKSGVKNGTLLPASDKVLAVELLKVNQQIQETESDKNSLLATLSSLIGTAINKDTNLKNPLVNTNLETKISRPELDLFHLKKEEIQRSESLLGTKNTPKIVGFATGGYGNPGLNMLDNSFQSYYIFGVKLAWNVFDWNTSKKQQQSLAINKDIVDNEVKVFKLNTQIDLDKQQKEIAKKEAFIQSDEEIIKLRKEVLQTVNAQLKNGVITSSAYLTELTNLYEDENTLIRHKIELQLAKANYNAIKGI